MQSLRLLVIAASLLPAQGYAIDIDCFSFRPLMQDDQLKRPSPPYCAESFMPFLDEFDFGRCRNELTAYQAEIEKYLRCLQEERGQAIKAFNEAVDNFNRRASQ